MPRQRMAKGAGKDEAAKAVDLTQEEREALAKGAPPKGPVVKTRGQDGTDVGNGIDDHVTVSEDEDIDISSIVVDESHLSTDEKVGRLAQLYRRVAKMQLVIGLWVLLNVFRNSLEDARSKDPQKQNSFNAICNHWELPEDLKGDTLRRYVLAAATMKELQGKGVDTDSLEYSHFREISKLPEELMREKVAKMVIEKSATARQTERLVNTEIAKARLERRKPKADGGDKDKFSKLAVEIIGKLDDPEKRIFNDLDLKALLLDPIQARAKFNFREQAKIYDKAERVLQKKAEEKSNLEKTFASNEANIEFLENLMDTFDSESFKTETK
jgi:hypothetical protein